MKYDEIKEIMENCRAQIREFDHINGMSSQLIEKLQLEVEEHKAHVRRLITNSGEYELREVQE